MEENTFDLRAILGLLRRRLRLILVTVIVVTAVAGFVIFSLAPVYTSSALILVDPSRKNLLAGDAQSGNTAADSARIDSEVEILRSDNVLLKVIEAENLLSGDNIVQLSLTSRLMAFLRLADPELPSAEQALSQALTSLRNAITVQRRGLTYLISVQARSGDPQRAAVLANATAEAYIQAQLASKVDSTLSARDLIQARISDAQASIGASEGAFDDFIESNIKELEATPGGSQIGQIRQQLEQLQALSDRNNRLAQSVQLDLAESDWDSLVSSLSSSALSELGRQREELLAQIEGGADSPTGIDLNAAVADLETRIRETANAEADSLEQSIVQSQTQETDLRRELRSAVLSSNLSADTLTQIYSLQQSAELARQQYQTLLSRLQDVETQADLQVADSRIVSPALAPLSPSFPNRLLLLGAALIGALGLGVGLAFLYENFIGGFLTEAQLSSVLRTRVATAIPRQRTKTERESIADLMINSPLSVFPESVRRLRAALEQGLRHNKSPGGKVIMITSSVPNEGKTTLALALARSYAASGHSTILIDCDLRKPSVHRHLGVEPSAGLLDYLSSGGSDNLSSFIARDPISTATIIVGARRSDLPTDQLLTGPSFERLLKAARTTFDVVIVDTPPIRPVVDGLYVAASSDAVVMVVRWASTSQQDVKATYTSLMQSKQSEAELVTVLSQQEENEAAYMRKYGDYYLTND
jgi:succinoglycan biosynthesis transport protein ExoP